LIVLPQGWEETLLSSAVAFGVPLVLAGVGECVVERAGVINIGVEGLMLVAALAAVVASHVAHSPGVGLMAGVLAASGVGLVFGLLVLYRSIDQVVAGTAVNILALGATGAAYFAVTQRLAAQHLSRLAGEKLPDWPIPGLSRLPGVGDTLFSGNALVYAAILLAPLSAWVLHRTRLGLQLRAVGEYPRAAEAAGADVLRTRLAAVLVGSALAGAGGVFLSIGHVVTFGENMIAGKGFIALALVIFGGWNPWGVLAGAAIFSLAVGMATVLATQGQGRPEEVALLALPYGATLLALVVRSGRTAAPAALAQPYARAG
jgi:ABC-type uncharacterized transport system permease subunit